ncbi:hypothetical protein JOC86_000298 [Bacillus pakistanensis]|uniref:Uncharacterized protein n=1 Tax=Rossellomorea pakistanensis TaxID=992288 RepID=A0ABS2N7D4_9BACI|nr:hypothetical protein [Bacillus pakistanensis]
MYKKLKVYLNFLTPILITFTGVYQMFETGFRPVPIIIFICGFLSCLMVLYEVKLYKKGSQMG